MSGETVRKNQSGEGEMGEWVKSESSLFTVFETGLIYFQDIKADML